jgi:hypothetical protein
LTRSIESSKFFGRTQNSGATLCYEMRKPFDLLAERPPGDKSGAKESRTPDLFVANEALYQLSYRPIVVLASGSSRTHKPTGWFTSTTT